MKTPISSVHFDFVVLNGAFLKQKIDEALVILRVDIHAGYVFSVLPSALQVNHTRGYVKEKGWRL